MAPTSVKKNPSRTVDDIQWWTKNLTSGAMDVGLLDIAPEIIHKILTFVSQGDLMNLRLTCKYLNEQASQPSLLSLNLMNQPTTMEEFQRLTMTKARLMPNIVALWLGEQSLSDPGNSASVMTKEFAKSLRKFCVGLRALYLECCRVKTEVSIADLSEHMSNLTLSEVCLENPGSFFASGTRTGGQLLGQSLSVLSLNYSCVNGVDPSTSNAIKGIATYDNLETLILEGVPDLSDHTFANLAGHLPNLTELRLIDLDRIGHRTFHTIASSFKKLTTIELKNCQDIRDEHLELISTNVQLETLVVDDCSELTEAGLTRVLEQQVNLKNVTLRSCNIDDGTITSIWQGLPYLECLEIQTDILSAQLTEIRNVREHGHLDVLSLEGVTMTDASIAQLVPAISNITRLKVDKCVISDVGFQAITDNLRRLVSLELAATTITDDSLSLNLPKLTALECLVVESENLSDNGVLSIAGYLSRLSEVNITFCCANEEAEEEDSSEGSFIYNRNTTTTAFKLNCLTMQGFKSDNPFITIILPLFLDVDDLCLDNIRLTAANVDLIANYLPRLKRLALVDSRTTDEVAIAVLSKFSVLEVLCIGNSCVTDEFFLRLLDEDNHGQVVEARTLWKLKVLSDDFPSTECLLAVAQVLCAMKTFRIRSNELDNIVSLKAVKSSSNSSDNCRKLTVAGLNVTDELLLALVKSTADFAERLVDLSLTNTSVSLAGFRTLAPLLTNLECFKLDVTDTDDDDQLLLSADSVMAELGQLLTSDLEELCVSGETLTDAGLPLLGRHLHTLKKLEVSHSSITLEGVNAMTARLRTIGEVVFRVNPVQMLNNALVAGGSTCINFADQDEENEHDVIEP